MDNKTALRIKAKAIRKTLNIINLSSIAVAKIREFEVYKNAQNVLIYYPMKYEINLLELLDDNKNFYLPKVCGEELLICPYTDKLEVSEFNVCEPCSKPVNPQILDLIIVPGLMADKNNYRLGYGGGFYDRFLSKFPQIQTIFPVAKELYIEKLPVNEFDVKIHHVVRC